jgi:transcriptional regulator with XRE-family HTH domain
MIVKANKTFIKNVRETIGKLQWTQAELARRCGYKTPFISRLLSGRHEPMLSTCEKIATALNMSLVDLLSGNSPDIGTMPPHSLEDCVKAVTHAALGNTIKD